jgi:hypothetical protein
MSGPGGAYTKRDQRRESRKEQFQRRQLERQRERERQLRNQRIRQGAIYGGVALAVILLGALIFGLIRNANSPSTSGGLQPANGQPVDSIECQGQEAFVMHDHTALDLYVDGQQVEVPAGVGIVAPPPAVALASNGLTTCLYALHVHQGEPNLVHIESPVKKDYTVGQLFDIWGQELTDTSFLGHPIDAQHKLTIEVYDESGKLVQTYSGKPRDLVFDNRHTFVYKYNSPDVKPALFDWSKF